VSKRYFEFSEGTSNKFWEVWIDGNKLMTRYGKIGASGQTTVKDEGSPAGAQKLYDKLIKEKTGKGYQEKGGGGAAPAAAAAPAAPAPTAKKAAKAEAAPAAAPAAAAKVVVEPGFRRFEFVEGSSNKFWEVKVEGEQQIVRFGKIGTAGQVKEKDFDSAGEAKADTKKLIAEKTGKGYVEVGVSKAPSNPALEEAIALDQDEPKNWRVFADWLIEQGEPWGEVIARAVQGKPDKAKQSATAKELLGDLEGDITWANGVISELDLQPEDAEDGLYESTLEKILKHPAGHYIRKLTLGLPPHEDLEWHMEGLAEAISSAGPLPFLEVLDMSPDADHMDQPSWRRVGDISGIWAAAPHLKELHLNGAVGSDDGDAIDLGEINAPHLEAFTYKSGGLDKSVAKTIGAAKLPKLKRLELYFGSEEYGNNGGVGDLKGILDGANLPALKTLGLKNSPWEENLITAVVNSKILPKLEVLDLSMGVLADKAATALETNAGKLKHLKKLILDDNYFSDDAVKRLKKALPNAQIGEQKDDEEPEYRYTSIAE
jgi:uncharacterized protein (TIGR02996 family)